MKLNGSVDNSKQKGKAMTNANIKQILKTFNLECEIAISKVKLSNRESSVKRIKKVFDTLNKLNERNVIKIAPQFLDLKLKELDVAFEYDLKKQEEKEILRRSKRTGKRRAKNTKRIRCSREKNQRLKKTVWKLI